MNLPMASPNENMKIDSSINPTPARRAERSSEVVEIFVNRLIDRRAALHHSSCPGIAVRRTASLPLAYVPAIHVFMRCRFKDVDARDKPGHDELNRLPPPHLCDTGRPSANLAANQP